MIQAVCFDLGETLIHYGPVNVARMLHEAAEVTYAYLQERLAALRLPSFDLYHRSTARAIKLRYLWAHLSNREFHAETLLDATLKKLNIHLGPEQLADLSWHWYKPLADRARIEPDLPEQLAALRQRGLKMAIISNTFCPAAVLDRQLQRFDLLEFFPVRIYSSDTVHRKPDPRIFRQALDLLDVNGHNSVMVGDSLRPDIRGALRLGMRAVFKRGELNARCRVQPTIPTITAIRELAPIIDRWNAQKPG